jgi:hypothetical protein
VISRLGVVVAARGCLEAWCRRQSERSLVRRGVGPTARIGTELRSTSRDHRTTSRQPCDIELTAVPRIVLSEIERDVHAVAPCST